MTNAFIYFWTAIFGVVLGSFFNVVILRDRKRKSILTDRSRCTHCNHVLAWYDLIPILSWVSLRGKCRYCKKPISGQYPLVELGGALVAMLAVWYGYVQHGSIAAAVFLALAFLLLLAISIIDLQTMEVPIDYCVAVAVLGLIANSFMRQFEPALIGLAVGSAAIAVILYGWKALTGKDGMGEGDIWVAGAIGAVVGWPLIAVGLMAAVFIGAIGGLAALGVSAKSLKSQIPFGPFLFLGMLAALIWGHGLLQWYIL